MLSGGRGLRSAALRPSLSRITAGATSAVFGPLRLLTGVRDHLECRASCRRRAPRQHIALQAGIIATRGLQRTLGDSEFDPLALQTRIELIDAPFGLGPIRADVDFDFGDAVAQHLYLLIGMGERGLARLERFSETVAALLERGARLLELTRLAIERVAGGRESLDHLLGAASGDRRFHRLALQRPDLL